ncbi:MAG: calcium-translocating P-type ATPase, PMCA-type [Bacteroidales bacterium]|nr:calcium-translocating P-type ATPase, PMCA-type [Bacteroidales bacterium]
MKTSHHYSGLTDQEVLESRRIHGSNVLTPPEKETFWDMMKSVLKHWISISMAVITLGSLIFAIVSNDYFIMPAVLSVAWILIAIVGFFGGFGDPLFKILITAFVLSMGISIYEYEGNSDAGLSTFFEPVGIIVALLLATGVAFFLERKNEKTFQSLNEVNDDTSVKVVRNDNVCQIPRRDVVVGDIVLLEQGEEIPADCKLLESLNLVVNESTLTGELQANKTTDPAKFDKEATYPSDEILKGTTIIEGYCTAQVTKVGDKTESGKVFQAAQVDEGDPTPLSEKLDDLADKITKASYIVAALIIVGRIITYFVTNTEGSLNWLDFLSYILNTVMIAVTLVVVAVPEGLPMSVTLSLAFSMRKLMKENTLPRTMHACETMGAASVICTDKTGTLTQNKMQVADAQLAEIQDGLLAEMIAANSTANLDFADQNNIKPIGNPTECALLLWLNARNVNYLAIRESTEVIERLPFSTENKYMATVVNSNVLNKKVLYIKGAPEIIMGFAELTDSDKVSYNKKLSEFQGRAYRTLALAYAEVDGEESVFADGKLSCSNLKFAGIFAIADPIRTDVPAAVKACTAAGIQVKIVTGDTAITAKEIGRQIGLLDDRDNDSAVLTGTEFAAMTDDELLQRIHGLKILSRARPNDKERLVKLLKQEDYVVAATGDGTNDAPALNAADVGLSMGDGTAVAKEASDMTIQDNSFSTISNAVMWGRSLYKNIQRFIMFQMTINVVACLIVLIGAFIGTQSPLTVTQMLWVNLIMDTFAAIALASLPPSKAVMDEKPRRVTDFIISKPMMKNIFGLGGFFTALLLVILIVMQHYDIASMADLLSFHFEKIDDKLNDYELSLFFTTFVMLQFWNMFNAKAFMTGKSAFHDLRNCQGFLLIAAVIFIGQILIVEIGGAMFNVCHLQLADWLWIIFGTMPVMIVGEIMRKINIKK